MKKTVVLSVFIILFTVFSVNASNKELRGVWVSSVYNLDYPSKAGLSETELRSEADSIIKNVIYMGQNAVFLQVRPCADSLYHSSVFPASEYLSGKQGENISFDPLEYFIKAAHENRIKLYAWINPFRITASKASDKSAALSSLYKDHPAALFPDSCVFAGDGRLYFDPGSLKAREIILDGVREILEKYDVDGIQYDDYFYPHTDFDDQASFKKNGKKDEELSDFRRRSVNELIYETSCLCREKGKEFGVSPSGVWATLRDMDGGVDTKGDQSYFSSYADSKAWVENKWVDYIAPQLYWSIGNSEGEFETLLSWWTSLTEKYGVKLYVGIAAYRAAEKSAEYPWKDGEEVISQLDMLKMKDRANGYIFFRYGSLIESGLKDKLSAYTSKRENRTEYPNLENNNSFEIKTNGYAVQGMKRTVLCTVRAGEKATVFSGGKAYRAVRRKDALKAYIKQEKTPALVIGDRFGCLSVRIEKCQTVSPEPAAKVTDIKCSNDGDFAVFEFYTGRECAARSELKDGFLKLYISPCVSGYIFESDLIKKAVTDEKNGVLCYTFLMNGMVQKHFVREDKDKVLLYVKCT